MISSVTSFEKVDLSKKMRNPLLLVGFTSFSLPIFFPPPALPDLAITVVVVVVVVIVSSCSSMGDSPEGKSFPEYLTSP